MTSVRCAECQCVQQDCMKVELEKCVICSRDVCCCANIHSRNASPMKPIAMAKIITTNEPDDCCASGSCENNKNDDALQGELTTSLSSSSSSGLFQFLRNIKALYAAALGIEILCIAAAEIGENTGLYLFGFNLVG